MHIFFYFILKTIWFFDNFWIWNKIKDLCFAYSPPAPPESSTGGAGGEQREKRIFKNLLKSA